MLSELLVQFAQLIPEEEGQNGVWAESEIRGSQAFVESCEALLFQSLGEAVTESFVQLPLYKKKDEKIASNQENRSSLSFLFIPKSHYKHNPQHILWGYFM